MHKTFDAKELNEIKSNLANKIWVHSQSPIGWSFLRKDFSFIFTFLPSLKVKEGFTIRAYRYVSDYNRSVKLQFWAVPINEWLPQPEECMVYYQNKSYPKPNCVLENLMDAIDGDGSFDAYLSASILFRTVNNTKNYTSENWGLNVIIDDELMKSADLFDRNLYSQKLRDINYRDSISKEEHFLFHHHLTAFNTDDWKWKLSRNSILWKPSVEFDSDKVKVTFYTYYGHVKKTILKYTDFYTKGSYRFDSSCEIIAEGGEGYFI